MLKLMRKVLSSELVEEEIQQIINVLRVEIAPVHAYLFGSASDGRMTDQSDYDLVLVFSSDEDRKKGKRGFAQARVQLPRRPFDVIWLTEEEFEKKKSGGGVVTIAIEDGRKLI